MLQSSSLCHCVFRLAFVVAGVMFFLVAMESNGNAQLLRRHRLNRPHASANKFEVAEPKFKQTGVYRLIFGTSQQHRYDIYDPRVNPAAKYSRYPKYTGAFHSSYFSNIGVPSGDIGFRGNGIYWSPW